MKNILIKTQSTASLDSVLYFDYNVNCNVNCIMVKSFRKNPQA